MLDPEIVLQKDPEVHPTAARVKKHSYRPPDVGIGILISIPCYRAGRASPEMIEYCGQYCGHGASKTAFELNHPGARFHGKVLKVARKRDMEPSVFMEAAELGLATRIYYNCDGVDADTGHCFHCWITDRTIPLDEFCRDENANKSSCSLAAFRCMLRAAHHGFYLSDCHFFNFGVIIDATENATEHLVATENATEHLVVIIDAGSRGIDRETLWAKRDINQKVMHKFWKACDEVSASCDKLQAMWKDSYNVEQCLQRASSEWQKWPFLTDVQERTSAILEAMFAKDRFRRSTAHSKSSYKMMELVGRFTAPDQWSSACFWECYRASEELQSELFTEQSNILDELYSRITTSRARDEELQNVMIFWGKLNEYRERECRRMMQSSEDQAVTAEQASSMLENFKHYKLWHELTYEQRRRKSAKQHAALNAILHKKAGWTHAARAIMQMGLPKLEQPAQSDDATEHINALGQFARDMAKWLVSFAHNMHTYRQTEEYQKKYQTSIQALEKRTKRKSESQSIIDVDHADYGESVADRSGVWAEPEEHPASGGAASSSQSADPRTMMRDLLQPEIQVMRAEATAKSKSKAARIHWEQHAVEKGPAPPKHPPPQHLVQEQIEKQKSAERIKALPLPPPPPMRLPKPCDPETRDASDTASSSKPRRAAAGSKTAQSNNIPKDSPTEVKKYILFPKSTDELLQSTREQTLRTRR
jgi:hypothetical protein